MFICIQAGASDRAIIPETEINESGETVTGLAGIFRQGQVFLTWNNLSNSNTLYKVYHSTVPIIRGSQLGQSDYLGYTWQYSAKDVDL